MSKPFLVIGAFIIWAAGSTYWYDCKVKRVCGAKVNPITANGASTPVSRPVSRPDARPDAPLPAAAPSPAVTPAVTPAPAASASMAAPAVTPTTANAAPAPGPISFMWADPGPIMSSAFADYKKGEVAKLKENEQLEIIGLYSAAEQTTAGNPTPNVGLARAEKTAALFSDSLPKERTKLSARLVTDDAAAEANKRANFFASVEIRSVPGSVAKPAQTVADAASKAAPAPIAPPPAPIVTRPITVAKTPAAAREGTSSGTSSGKTALAPIPIRFRIRTTDRGPDPAIDAYLEKVAASIKSGSRASVTGFTDGRGNTDANRKLAKARAESIRKELIALGAPADRIEITAKGSESPTADNDTIEGRHNNRRVEITLK
jgi:OmpA-OmpF porin, OOP family